MIDYKKLYQCPICRASHKESPNSCRRCGSDLELLVKIRREAWERAQSGKSALSLLPLNELLTLQLPLPEGWSAGAGFITY